MKSYLITDSSFYTHDKDMFAQRLREVFGVHIPDMALYRDKDFEMYDDFAELFVTICKEYKVKSVLHNTPHLAKKLGAFGLHVSGENFAQLNHAQGLFKIASTHSLEQIKQAQEYGTDAVTYSPIFASPQKSNPVGLDSLKLILDTISLPVIALGGITTQSHIEAVSRTGAYGFASIRYFFIKDT